MARNPEPDSTLPYLIVLPLGPGLVLKARDTWPRTAKIYCHRAEPASQLPPGAEILEEVAVRSCVRKGPAIDLVLDRAQEYKSQLVFTKIAGGREAIFWQTPNTARGARPGVRVPKRRAAGLASFTILIDTRERYPYKFALQQAETVRQGLSAGDYGVELDGEVVAAVERKTLTNLAHDLNEGAFEPQLRRLALLPRAAVVVEDRWSDLFKTPRIDGGRMAELLAYLHVTYPHLPVAWCETRPLAEDWTYRFLGAALVAAREGRI